MFREDPNIPSLSAKKGEDHNEVTENELCFSQRSRVDLKLSSGHYCARVKEPTKQDFSKPRHLSRHTWATRFIPSMISADKKGEAVLYVDGAHAAYADGKRNSGIFLTIVKGVTMSVSKKLGVFTVSSTETQIAVDGKRFPKYDWFRNFSLVQGDSAKEYMLMKEN